MKTTHRLNLLLALTATTAASLAACSPIPEEEGSLEEAGAVEAQAEALTSGCVPGPNQVALFVDPDQQGPCALFTAPTGSGLLGAARGPKLTLVRHVGHGGFPNDSASSIAVGANVSAILFDHGDFNGYAYHTPHAGNLAMNDRTTSLLIVPKSKDCSFNPNFQPRAGEVVVWDEANFGGRCHVYSADDRFRYAWSDTEVSTGGHTDGLGGSGEVYMLEFAVKSDTISSVKVGPGTKVTLYRDDGLRGSSRVIQGPSATAFLGNKGLSGVLNGVSQDEASSLAVEKTQ